MRRREFLKSVAGAGAMGLAAPAVVRAQAPWPDKPVKMIVPFGAGAGTDLVARPWAEKLTEAFGQQFVVENRGGASGMIGTEAAGDKEWGKLTEASVADVGRYTQGNVTSHDFHCVGNSMRSDGGDEGTFVGNKQGIKSE